MKSEIFDGLSFCKVFTINLTDNYYRGTAPTLKIQMFKQSYFSQFLGKIAFENSQINKKIFNVDHIRATLVNVIWVPFDWLINQGCRSTKIVGVTKISKKCWPPWLAEGENIRFQMKLNNSNGFECFMFFSGKFSNFFKKSFCKYFSFSKGFFHNNPANLKRSSSK